MENNYREIRFRGLDQGNVWRFGSLVVEQERPKRTAHFIYDWSSYECEKYLVKPQSIGQATGYLDSNQREVFESDLVFIDRKDGFSSWNEGVIVYGNGSFLVCYTKKPTGILSEHSWVNESGYMFGFMTDWNLTIKGIWMGDGLYAEK